jgi:hypothetical protein
MIDKLASLIGDRVIVLALIGAVVALAFHGTIDGQASIGFLGAIATGILGGHFVARGAAETRETTAAAEAAPPGEQKP